MEQGRDELYYIIYFEFKACVSIMTEIWTLKILEYVRRGLSTKYRESLTLSGRNTLADATILFGTLQEDITAFTTRSTSSKKDGKGSDSIPDGGWSKKPPGGCKGPRN